MYGFVMLKNYLAIALRTLWRHRAFSVINILGLSVGMTAFFLIFQYVRFETSYDRFHSKADRIYRVVADVITPTETLRQGLATAPIAVNMKKDFPEVEDAVRLGTDSYLIRLGDNKFQEPNSVLADSSFFDIFDFPLVEGDRRTALKEPMSIVLSQSTAKRLFGDANPMGRHLLLTGGSVDMKVTGVMKDIPENSQIKANLIVSLSSNKMIYGQPTPDSEWTNHMYYTYLLLKPHTNPEALQAKFPAWMEMHNGRLMKQLQMHDSLILEPFPKVYLYSKYDGFVQGSISNVYIFSVIGAFILLLACINFINLTTARSTERAKEVGIRKVAGALRFQLAGQFIGESVVLSLVSFVLTMTLCALLLPLFNQLAGKTISTGIFSRPMDIVILFLLAVAVGLAAGFYPALVLSSFRPVSVLRGRFATGGRGSLLRKGLVVFQFTISVLLLIATAVVYTQVEYMRTRDLGFSREETIIIPTNGDMLKDVFRQSLTSLPGVLSTCYSSNVPGNSPTSAYSEMENSKGEMQKTNLDTYFIDFDFINQYGLRLVAGRGFSRDFPTDSTQAMVINETAAKSIGYSAAQAAIGRNFSQWGRKGKIIGVLKDFHYMGLQQPIAPMVMRYEPYFAWISVKVSTRDLPATVKAIGDKWTEAIPHRPYEYWFLNEWFDQQYRAQNRFGSLFFNFAVLAIFISCLGLLGLASYNTLQRTKEIGIRKILGAGVSGIVNLLSVDFIKLVGIAFLIAAPLAWLAMDRWLSDFAYHTRIPWWVFAGAGVAAALIAFITISFQAIRAATSNPVRSLRTE
jgi:putative ABC transport system permease protein